MPSFANQSEALATHLTLVLWHLLRILRHYNGSLYVSASAAKVSSENVHLSSAQVQGVQGRRATGRRGSGGTRQLSGQHRFIDGMSNDQASAPHKPKMKLSLKMTQRRTDHPSSAQPSPAAPTAPTAPPERKRKSPEPSSKPPPRCAHRNAFSAFAIGNGVYSRSYIASAESSPQRQSQIQTRTTRLSRHPAHPLRLLLPVSASASPQRMV